MDFLGLMVVNFKNDMVGDNVVRASLEGTLVSQQGVKKKKMVCVALYVTTRVVIHILYIYAY